MCRCPWSWLFKPCLLITPKGALDFEGKAAETTASFFQDQLSDFTFQTLVLQDTGAYSSSWLLSCFTGSAAHGLPVQGANCSAAPAMKQ